MDRGQCGVCGIAFDEQDVIKTQTVEAQNGSEAYDRQVHPACIASQEVAQ